LAGVASVRVPTTRRAAVAAALLLVLTAAGCGGSSGPSDDDVSSRVERFIASDIRAKAIDAGIGGSLTVHGVTCAAVDRTHFRCRIRTTSEFGRHDADSIADAIYDRKTERMEYDIRPTAFDAAEVDA
jgi:hypothetical protein